MFHANNRNKKDGKDSRCKICCITVRKRKYEKTRNDLGYFVKFIYSTMKRRCTNPNSSSAKYYLGLPLLDREEFLDFSLNDEELKKMFKEWIDSEWDRKLTPSIDRIFPNLGYTINNIQWVTLSENCKRANLYRHHGTVK